MLPNVNLNIESIWRKVAEDKAGEKPKAEREVIMDLVDVFREEVNKIWQCDVEELKFIKDKFKLLSSSNSMNFVLTHIDQTLDIYAVARKGVLETVELIKKYNITDQNYLFRIAKICGEHSPLLVTNIQKFGIKDKELLFEIAKICLQRSAGLLAKFIQNFDLDEAHAKTLLLSAIHSNPRVINYWPKEDKEDLADLFPLSFNHEKAKKILDSYIAKYFPGKNFERLAARIMNMKAKAASFAFEKQANERELKNNQQELLQHLGVTLFLLARECKDDQINRVNDLRLIEAIQDFRRPELRWELNSILIEVAAASGLDSITVDERSSYSSRLLKLLGASLILRGCGKEETVKLVDIIENNRELLKNASLFNVLMENFLKLTTARSLTPQQRRDIVKRLSRNIANEPPKQRGETLYAELQSVGALLFLNNPKYLINSDDSFEAALTKGFNALFSQLQIDNFSDKYYKTFGSSRHPSAIVTYAAKAAGLNDERVMKACMRFVAEVLEGTFKRDRNSTDNNVHLKTIGEYGKGILEKWQKSLSPKPLSDVVAVEPAKFTLKDWLYAKLIDERRLRSFEGRLPTLFNYLQRGYGKENIDEYLREIKERRLEEIKKSQKGFAFLDVELNCLKLFQTDDINRSIGLLNNLRKILAKPPFNGPEFLNDIDKEADKFIKERRAVIKQAKVSDYVIMDTEEHMDLLLCGTEAGGSCQSVYEDAYLNKGLLGYLLDGKNRMLAIKTGQDDRGRIQARCMLKLLWDGEQPVLLRENIYPRFNNDQYMEILDNIALRKAQALGIPLISMDGTGEEYPRPVHSLGGPAPFEYSDAFGGIADEGKYMIKGARFLRP